MYPTLFADRGANVRGRVLIADDSPAQRRMLAAIVEGLGWEARCVSNGERAVQACAGERFEAVLIDLHMPGAGGLEATRRIRALGGWAAAAPIVMLSAAMSPEVARRARMIGVTRCLSKPARPAQIAEALCDSIAVATRKLSA